MKKIVPFTKTIHFKTMIAEVTNIEVKHDLEVKENNTIEGDILVDGSYKMHEASQIEEEFHYNLPFTIEVDSKYDIETCNISINDFYFEIINEEDLKVNVELEIENVTEKPEEVPVEEEASVRDFAQSVPVEIDEKKEKLEIDNTTNVDTDLDADFPPKIDKEVEDYMNSLEEDIMPDTKQVETPDEEEVPVVPNMKSIFDTISGDETFVTYYVYIVREADTVDSIIEKYQTTRESIASYNDLENIKVGSKIIIPCQNE